MRTGMNQAFAADKRGLKIRWLLVALGGLALMRVLPIHWVTLGCFIASVAGLVVQFSNRTLQQYERGRYKWFGFLRTADALSVCFVGVVVPDVPVPIWAIACPLIVLEGYSTRDMKRVAVTTFACIALVILSALGGKTGNLSNASLPVLILLGSAFVGVMAAKEQVRNQKLDKSLSRLATITNTASSISISDNLQALFCNSLRDTIHDLGATAGIIVLKDFEDPTVLRTEVAYSVDGEFAFPSTIKQGDGISGYVASSGQPLTLVAKANEVLTVDNIDLKVLSAVSIPLSNREFASGGIGGSEEILGALTILNTYEREALDSDDLSILQSVGSLLANAIHNARLEERHRTTFLRTLESLAKSLEARDDYTRGHSQRVCELSILIAQKLGFQPDALEEIRIGTILHDIGKIGVPDAILNKPARLTDEEFTLMKQHPVMGYEICKPLMLSEGILMIIRNHHEKLDGTGYPDGLKGGELPLSLRIVCVADAFDAMSSRRPYRAVMEMSSVLGELSKGAGVQFDPVVVETLKELLSVGDLDSLYSEYWEVKNDLVSTDGEAEDKVA